MHNQTTNTTAEQSLCMHDVQAKGQLAQITASPKGGRVIQSCAKFGSNEERAQLMQEISPHLYDLAKSPYGHFTVVKLVQLVPKSDFAGELQAF